MLNLEQRTKRRETVNKKVGPIELLLIPHRIERSCITRAKTNEAKQRLVSLAREIAYEDMRRVHVPTYPRPTRDVKHNYEYKPQSLGAWILEKVKFWK